MSYNLYVEARSKRIFNKDKVIESYNLYQTPTEITYKVLASVRPDIVYREWLAERNIVDTGIMEFLIKHKKNKIVWYTV
jgi:hypothetical protein